MNSLDELTLMNTLLKAFEESSGHAAAPSQRPSPSLPVSNGIRYTGHRTFTVRHQLTVMIFFLYLVECAYDQEVPVNRGRVKPPVSRPSARLAFLQQMEAHELSAIQEVDTPVNISLDAGTHSYEPEG